MHIMIFFVPLLYERNQNVINHAHHYDNDGVWKGHRADYRVQASRLQELYLFHGHDTQNDRSSK